MKKKFEFLTFLGKHYMAEGNITFRGFPGTEGQMFLYISLKKMKYLYNILRENLKIQICLIYGQAYLWAILRGLSRSEGAI